MKRRVTIQWTATALKALQTLPPKVQRGLISKIDDLFKCDPRQAGKPLAGPLQGFRSIKYSRYRALFQTVVEELAGGNLLLHVKVQIVLAGIRKERDKNDVYEVAKKLVELGLIPTREFEEHP